jgi:hypothetical protein
MSKKEQTRKKTAKRQIPDAIMHKQCLMRLNIDILLSLWVPQSQEVCVETVSITDGRVSKMGQLYLWSVPGCLFNYTLSESAA